ncbi:LysR family transcriptional regulator [Pelagibacterium halotolerans]|uniref:LysR family transcriptional regulator n=1 Tax=Pelagibacterium halotolerans TaxID=531813 RepID=UPI0038508A14
MQLRMDWRAIKFDWNRARAFLVTAEEGSLSAAARALGMAQPTLGRQVDALEQELGVVLFERAGRGLILTPAGLDLLDHVRAMGEAANRMSLAASGNAQSIDGSICITASEIYSAYLLPPIIERLRREVPGLAIEIVATNAAIDLRRREADIAIRSFQPTQPDLIARKIGDDHGRFYATPAYIERIGNPKTPDDLSNAEFIAFDIGDMMIDAFNRMGLKLTRDNFPITTGSHFTHWQLVKQGVAIGVVPEWIGDAEPAVRRVLPDFDLIPVPVWLTAHRELNTSRRVRLVFDVIAEELGRLF